MRIATILMVLLMAGCSTIKDTGTKLMLTDLPAGKYRCAIHGPMTKAYKVVEKVYCIVCVNQNIGKVELVMTGWTNGQGE